MSESSSGTVLFGGYDTGKYSGQLTELDIQPDQESGNITSMTVAWTSLSITDPTEGSELLTDADFVSPAVLDSGTSLTYIPPDLFELIATFSGAVESEGLYLVDCNGSSYTGTLDYGFGGQGGAVIQVPFSELVLPLYDNSGSQETYDDGSPVCTLGIMPATDGTPVLFGDTFLRSAYVIYNLDALTIAIAQSNFGSGTSNVQEITGDTTPAGASTPASSLTAKQTATGVVAPGLQTTVTSSKIASKVATSTIGGGGITSKAHTATSTGSGTTPATATASQKSAAQVGISMINNWVLVGLIAVQLCA